MHGSVALNVAAGTRTTVNELAARVLEATGSAIAPEHQPARPGDVRHSLADLSRTTDVLGFAPQIELAAGLEASIEHYRSLAVAS